MKKSTSYLLQLSLLLIFLLPLPSLPEAKESKAYSKVLKQHHRHGEVYDRHTLNAIFVWDAIYQGPALREQTLRTLSEIYRWSEKERVDYRHKEQSGRSNTEDFIVVLYTYDRKANDLESKKSVWRVLLEANGRSYPPLQIARIKPNAIEAFLYPFVKPWNQMYRVSFPQEALRGASEFQLSLVGVQGEDHLAWALNQ